MVVQIFRLVSFVVVFILVYLQPGSAQTKKVIDVTIDVNKTYQTISNFSASDAWSCQFVGNWPKSKKNAIADLLFSMDTLANGNPKGIGLSLWRFNIGAGSAGQGDASGIKDEWRRAASFIKKDSGYHADGVEGQLWFLKAARQRGVKQFLGFFNSPPVKLTTNAKAYASKGKGNIDSNQYNHFADYAINVAKAIKQNTGIELDYISPVNEPQWDWSDGGQEGCPYSNKEITGVVKAFNTALLNNRMATKILVTESGHHKYLFADEDKPGKGNQINDFFNKSSPFYIGNLSNVSKTIASHSYFTSSPFFEAMTIRKKIADSVAKIKGLEYWQSEYCILGDNGGEMKGDKKDLGMDAALYVARVVHADLVGGNAAAWQWWLAISPYDYKDGLIYIDKNKQDGNYSDSKMLWALGNYSRFIRPGMKRIKVEINETPGVFISAYKNNQNKLVVVIVNMSSDAQVFRINESGRKPYMLKTYTTSASNNLDSNVASPDKIQVAASSIVTVETF